MKKSMIALAVLGAFAGAASAQSSVTLFGIIDAAVARVDGNGAGKTGLTNSGLNSSRLGFRGTEDLGGGLSAKFWLEAPMSNDDGNPGALTFQRRSWVGLAGGFGEIRLGREYTPSFWNLTVFDAFGTNGVGSNLTAGMGATAGLGAAKALNGNVALTAAQTANLAGAWANSAAVRANNSINYSLPGNLGGFYGQVMYAFGETASNSIATCAAPGAPLTALSPAVAATNNGSDGNYFGVRFGYANGPLDVAFATGKTKAVCANDFTATNIGAAYDFGVVKPMLLIAEEKNGFGSKVQAIEISATAPMGGGELRAAYSKYDVKTINNVSAGSTPDFKKIAIGYGYNLSKRSQVYGTYARTSNGAANTVGNGTSGLGGISAAPGGNSSGLELGLRHSF
jgi:predicted porin